MCVANIPHAHNVRSKHSSGRLVVLSTIVRNITGNKHFFHQVGVAPSHLSLLLGKGQSCWVNLSSSYPRDGSARAGIYSTEGTVLPVVKQHCRSSYDAVTRKNVACPASARRERTRNACAWCSHAWRKNACTVGISYFETVFQHCPKSTEISEIYHKL